MNLVYTGQVDVGLVHFDVLEAALSQPADFPEVEDNIRVISQISLDDIHILAGPDIQDISQLENAVVNFGPGTMRVLSTPQLLFRALDIPVQQVAVSQVEAIEKIKNKEIAATVITATKPHGIVQNVTANRRPAHCAYPADRAAYSRLCANADWP